MKVKKEVAFAEEVVAAEAAAAPETDPQQVSAEKKEDGAGNTGTAKRKKKKKGEEVMMVSFIGKLISALDFIIQKMVPPFGSGGSGELSSTSNISFYNWTLFFAAGRGKIQETRNCHGCRCIYCYQQGTAHSGQRANGSGQEEDLHWMVARGAARSKCLLIFKFYLLIVVSRHENLYLMLNRGEFF